MIFIKLSLFLTNFTVKKYKFYGGMKMSYVLNENLPHQKYFEDISRIPRGSKNENEVSDYVVAFGEKLGLGTKKDYMGNVIIYKNATDGYKDHPPVIIQAHLDMVCEKNGDCDHDFLKDPINLYIEDGFVKAKGTTLGADDGYGVAAMMAILEDTTLKHPPLEFVFTVQEEIGLVGAQALEAKDFHGKKLINLDMGNDLLTNVSCSGGLRFHFFREMTMEKCQLPVYRLEIRGLYGGHSGGNIHLELGNSNKIASRVIYHLNNALGINLVDIDGGSKENAIPRECTVLFATKEDFTKIESIVKAQEKIIKKELEFSDAGLTISVYEDKSDEMCQKDISDKIITMFYLLPTGLKHRNIPLDVTAASQNFGVIKTENNTVKCTYSLRGALESYNDEGQEILINFCKIFDFQWESGFRYPAWEYVKESPLREILKIAYKDFYNREILEKATHGGLECGIFKKIIPDIDIVTLGPQCFDAHTPTERMNLESFDKFYSFLVKFLEKL